MCDLFTLARLLRGQLLPRLSGSVWHFIAQRVHVRRAVVNVRILSVDVGDQDSRIEARARLRMLATKTTLPWTNYVSCKGTASRLCSSKQRDLR